ncbi:hypothetical protein DUI87_18973 [Hirundo rustica rustica]|uniref:Integrase-type domain-containing protein n=1 Tax=Hirundo rustica rustica TaxID=333673 RepID=A0A3M0JTW7_HIRRU|nr:hypothetical protein DUI87_18973 [Hirundo rustica rustica]
MELGLRERERERERGQPDGLFQPYSKIKQLPSEPFVTFVERLTRAIELQVKKEGAQEQVLEEMALTNANEQCKAAILSLPMDPAPTLDDMLQKSPDVMVKDSATREIEGPHDLVTWSHGYACVSTPSGLKWVPAEWVKPFIPKSAKPPAEAYKWPVLPGEGESAKPSPSNYHLPLTVFFWTVCLH